MKEFSWEEEVGSLFSDEYPESCFRTNKSKIVQCRLKGHLKRCYLSTTLSVGQPRATLGLSLIVDEFTNVCNNISIRYICIFTEGSHYIRIL